MRDFGSGFNAFKRVYPEGKFCCVCPAKNPRLVEDRITVYPIKEFFEMLRLMS